MNQLIKVSIILMAGIMLLCACNKTGPDRIQKSSEINNTSEEANQSEKSHNLTVTDQEENEASTECTKVMEQIKSIYPGIQQDGNVGIIMDEKSADEMANILQKKEETISFRGISNRIANYEKLEQFLEDSSQGMKGETVVFNVNRKGEATRSKFIFDGTNMTILDTIASWNEKGEAVITNSSKNKLQKWQVTPKGWFIYEYSVPAYPEVTEVVNGYVMIRVRPIDAKFYALAQKYLLPIGYRGNNLLCSDWSAEQLQNLDYNGLFQYLCAMKYGKECDEKRFSAGVPKVEFEQLMMEYLPVNTKQLELYAVYDKESQTYDWNRLACLNYSPNAFGSSIPEITDTMENEDGSVTLTIDAVCEPLGDDAVMSHKLTVRYSGENGILYLKNEVLNDGLQKIPAYQYRFGNS